MDLNKDPSTNNQAQPSNNQPLNAPMPNNQWTNGQWDSNNQYNPGNYTINKYYTTKPPLSPKEKAAADKLGWISAILLIFSKIGLFPLSILGSIIAPDDSSILANMMVSVLSACHVASLVLMIVMRVKYPQSTFGKVLMWIHIGCLLLLL